MYATCPLPTFAPNLPTEISLRIELLATKGTCKFASFGKMYRSAAERVGPMLRTCYTMDGCCQFSETNMLH